MNKYEIDQLGERLKQGPPTKSDLQKLDLLREQFLSTHEHVIQLIVRELGLAPAFRSKTSLSIVEKLKREPLKLSRIQDIVGWRMTVADRASQDEATATLSKCFNRFRIVDRRAIPRNNYRAVHLIVEVHGKQVEIQIRTKLQHIWSKWCEKVAEETGFNVKYGEGDPELLEALKNMRS